MYLAAYEYVFPSLQWAVAATAVFVVVSQLKINVTNAYAGSLAWSNFFSRLTHSHPGRVVWVLFNTLIAFMLMEMNVFQALGDVLGLYSNIAIAWIMTVVADLVINKPLGLSPKGIEFKRAHLYDINPVGVGSMALASALSVAAYLGAFGADAKAFSAVVALATAFLAAPALAWATKGRYYIARANTRSVGANAFCAGQGGARAAGGGHGAESSATPTSHRALPRIRSRRKATCHAHGRTVRTGPDQTARLRLHGPGRTDSRSQRPHPPLGGPDAQWRAQRSRHCPHHVGLAWLLYLAGLPGAGYQQPGGGRARA
jgi:hypothetical protein